MSRSLSWESKRTSSGFCVREALGHGIQPRIARADVPEHPGQVRGDGALHAAQARAAHLFRGPLVERVAEVDHHVEDRSAEHARARARRSGADARRPGARMPRSCSTVPPPMSSAQIWCGSVVSRTSAFVTGSRCARTGDVRVVDLRRDGGDRVPRGEADFGAVDPDGGRPPAPGTGWRPRWSRSAAARPRRRRSRAGSPATWAPSEISAALRADVSQVVHGDHHVPASARHAAVGGAKRRGLRRGSRRRGSSRSGPWRWRW